MTPLHCAAEIGHLSVVEFLVNQNADINAKGKGDLTPLHFAARDGHLSVVDYLVNQNADLNAKDKNGETPLGLAREIGIYQDEDQKKAKLDVVEFLKNKGGK